MDFAPILAIFNVLVILAAIAATVIIKVLPLFTRWAYGEVLTCFGEENKSNGWSTYTLKTGEKVVVNRHAVWLPPGSPSRDSQDDWDEAHSLNRRP